MRVLPLLAVFACLLSSWTHALQPKELDLDVVYNEERLPRYTLPPLLVTTEGDAVTTPEIWRDVRRPQIVGLFSSLVYGQVPAPLDPIETTFDVIHADGDFMGGRATRKEVALRFENRRGSAEMLVLVFVPNDRPAPAPALMLHSFDNTRSEGFAEHKREAQLLRNGWPLGALLDAGLALVVVHHADLVDHNEVEFGGGIHQMFYGRGQSFPRAHEWGVLATIAWGGMRALDYLETDEDVDAARVAIMGHSKLGKAALWTGAQDERFAAVISAQSGCAGAALWRRRSGETLEKMVTRFPYWLCRNAWKFVGQEDDLPVDQHMLLALVAPRPLYVMSAEKDSWADPRGEYLSAWHASEVYRLLGKKALTSADSPPVGEALVQQDLGYHVRPGGHSVNAYDWQQVIGFLTYHLVEGIGAASSG